MKCYFILDDEDKVLGIELKLPDAKRFGKLYKSGMCYIEKHTITLTQKEIVDLLRQSYLSGRKHGLDLSAEKTWQRTARGGFVEIENLGR